MARVGQASRHSGLRQCWHRTAKFFPIFSSVRTRTLAEAGATFATFRVEQVEEYILVPFAA
jgi:hypothetical protein